MTRPDQKRFYSALLLAVGLTIYAQPAAATLQQYWPFDDGGSSATAANLAVGGNVGQLSAGGIPESWVSSGLHGPLTSRSTDSSTAALLLDGLFFETMNGGDLGLQSNLWIEGDPQPAGGTNNPSGGQATVSMWINPATVGTADNDRLFGHLAPAGEAADIGAGGTIGIPNGNNGPANGLVVWAGDGTGWSPLAAGDTPQNTIVADTWQHLAFVYNFGSVKSYLNGVRTQTDENLVVAQAGGIFDFDTAGSGRNQDFGLGARFSNGTTFFGSTYNGLVDDLAIWDSALTAARVGDLAGGTAPRDIDDSIGANVEPDFMNEFIPPRPRTPGPLVHYWPLDDTTGTTATSGVPGGNVGTVVAFDETKLNDPAELAPGDWSSDIPAQLAHSTGALDFEGGTPLTYMDGGNIGLRTDADGGDATVSLWFKPRNMNDDNRILVPTGFGTTVCCGAGLGGHIHSRADGSIEIWRGNAWLPTTDPGALEEGEWHHLAFVWVEDDVTTYVNGDEQFTVESNFDFDADNGIATDAPDANLGFGLGRSFDSIWGESDAIFDDVAVYAGSLTEDQITMLAGGVSPLDLLSVSPADLNMDGFVDGLDLGILLGNWNQTTTPDMGELDGTPPVDGLDLGILLGAWNPAAEGGQQAIPEPSAWLLLVAGGLVLATIRRTAGY